MLMAYLLCLPLESRFPPGWGSGYVTVGCCGLCQACYEACSFHCASHPGAREQRYYRLTIPDATPWGSACMHESTVTR